MHSDHSTSPTSSEDEDTKFFKLERASLRNKPRSCSVSSDTLQPIPEARVDEEGLGNFIRRSGSIKRRDKSKRYSRKSVSPKNVTNLEQWSYGVEMIDDYCEVQKSYSCISAFDKGIILEEDTDAGDKEASPRISLMVDKTEEILDKKRRHYVDSSESIQEERNEEEKVQTFRHSELNFGNCDEINENRITNLFVIPSESIKEEDEGEERIMLKHDDFLKRIAMNDEQFIQTSDIMRSSLQEVWEEDEDQGMGGG